jgi:hypothetical protein
VYGIFFVLEVAFELCCTFAPILGVCGYSRRFPPTENTVSGVAIDPSALKGVTYLTSIKTSPSPRPAAKVPFTL